jgi:biotin carboxyl carrier protein
VKSTSRLQNRERRICQDTRCTHLPLCGCPLQRRLREHPVPATGPLNEEEVCRSPIAGIVVKISAQPGQQIQTGDTLLVLEAMKMETNITALISGIIAKINVSQGDSLQSGQVLVEFE